MDGIGNEFRKTPGIGEGGAYHPRTAVMVGRHGVVEVRITRRSGIQNGGGFVRGGGAVAYHHSNLMTPETSTSV
jgi:hypothetical protein